VRVAESTATMADEAWKTALRSIDASDKEKAEIVARFAR
jgi:hypothetical protein